VKYQQRGSLIYLS